MGGESKLEKYIKDYVLAKTAEHVELYLQSDIVLKHKSKHGNILLATFWANILQHPKNFPKESHQYTRTLWKDPASDSRYDKLILTTDEVKFTVIMDTGTLKIGGQYVYEWFSRDFQRLLDNADEEFAKTYEYSPTPEPVKVSSEDDGYDDPNTEIEDYIFMRNREHTELPEYYNRLTEGEEDLVEGLDNMNVDATLFHGSELAEELELLTAGHVKDALEYVYKMWKSLLNRWFSERGTQIYLASPFLDTKRLQDVIRFYLRYRSKGQLNSLFTQQACDTHDGEERSTTMVQKAALVPFSRRAQLLIEYKIFRRMLYPKKNFHTKFIAGVKDGQAEVLVTTANFHSNYFSFANMEFCFFAKMTEEEFLTKYVDPISVPAVVRM